jgi:hypothetical protein
VPERERGGGEEEKIVKSIVVVDMFNAQHKVGNFR